jgi:hypothetical protein
MGFLYEPGPLQPADPSVVPEVQVVHENETFVTPTAQQFFEGEGLTATRLSEIAGAGVPDVEGDTSSTLRPAYDELGYQLGTQHDMNLSPAVAAAGRSISETSGVIADLPSEDSDYDAPEVPGEGSTEGTVIDVPTGPEQPPLN